MARLLIFDMCGISTLLLPGLLGKMLGTDGVFAKIIIFIFLYSIFNDYVVEGGSKRA